MKRSLQVIALIISYLLSNCGLIAQEAPEAADSLLLGVVNVHAARISSTGIEKWKLDEVHGLMSGDLGQYLDRLGRTQVLSNGATGSASSVRNRGMSSDHSVLYWNNVPINSLSLGTCDLSMIPVFFFDDVELKPSAGFVSDANSNLGSGIRFMTSRKVKPSFFSRVLSSVNTINNSFTGIDVGGPLAIHRGDRNWSLGFRTRLFYQDIRNEFDYTDVFQFEHPVIRQTHNDGINRGIQQEIKFAGSHAQLEALAWYQSKQMQLPVLMGSSGMGSSEQKDDVFRSQCVYRFFGERTTYSATVAWMDEGMRYRDKQQSQGNWLIDSKIRSQVFYSDAKAEIHLWKGLLLQNGLTFISPKIQNSNYQHGEHQGAWGQYNASLVADFKSNQLKVEGRYDCRMKDWIPNYSISYNHQITRKRLQTNAGFNWAEQLRFPDFNELYWIPGGNADLLPERGRLFEITMNTIWKIADVYSLELGGKKFYRNVSNWIQWVPGNSGIWSPVNYKTVRIQGYDVPLIFTAVNGTRSLKIEVKYNHTTALYVNHDEWIAGEAKTLTYTPEHTVCSGLQFISKSHFVSIRNNFVSSRYTEESNLEYRSLPSYQLFFVEMGTSFSGKKWMVKPSVSVDNVFDVSYQSLRSYAMPGRVIQINLQINFNHEKL